MLQKRTQAMPAYENAIIRVREYARRINVYCEAYQRISISTIVLTYVLTDDRSQFLTVGGVNTSVPTT